MKRGMLTLLALAGLLPWAIMPIAAARSPRSGSNEANKTLVRRVFDEVINRGKMATINQVIAPTAVNHGSTAADDERLSQTFGEPLTALRAAYPDVRFTVEDQIAEGDKVATRFTMRGTNTGRMRDAAGVQEPTGKAVRMMGIVIHRIRGGKIVESWQVTDRLGAMQQVGFEVRPPRPAAPGR